MSRVAKGEPILIDCEGSGCPPAGGALYCREICLSLSHVLVVGHCAMCGNELALTEENVVIDHKRDDILARLERGDFG